MVTKTEADAIEVKVDGTYPRNQMKTQTHTRKSHHQKCIRSTLLGFFKDPNCSFHFPPMPKKKGTNITKDVSVRTTANQKGELSEAEILPTLGKPNADRPIPMIERLSKRKLFYRLSTLHLYKSA